MSLKVGVLGYVFLERLFVGALAAATSDYKDDPAPNRRDGSIAGFEACRGLSAASLGELLVTSRAETDALRRKFYDNDDPESTTDKYWYQRCFELEVEWVCNVVSAILMNQGLPPIVPPTAFGVMKAAELLGIK